MVPLCEVSSGTRVKWSRYIVSVRQLITVFLLVITVSLQADSGD